MLPARQAAGLAMVPIHLATIVPHLAVMTHLATTKLHHLDILPQLRTGPATQQCTMTLLFHLPSEAGERMMNTF